MAGTPCASSLISALAYCRRLTVNVLLDSSVVRLWPWLPKLQCLADTYLCTSIELRIIDTGSRLDNLSHLRISSSSFSIPPSLHVTCARLLTMFAKAIWTKIASCDQLKRSSVCVSSIDSKVYVFGGEMVPRLPRDNNIYEICLAEGVCHLYVVGAFVTVKLGIKVPMCRKFIYMPQTSAFLERSNE